jgi:Holliday junction resolvase RusA-like endonuclease
MTVYAVSSPNKTSMSAAIAAAINTYPKGTPFHLRSGNPVEVKAKFFFHRPKCHYGLMGLGSNAPFAVTKCPDIDNLIKLVLDALQGIAYANDNVVFGLSASKHWIKNSPNATYSMEDESLDCMILKIVEYQNLTNTQQTVL